MAKLKLKTRRKLSKHIAFPGHHGIMAETLGIVKCWRLKMARDLENWGPSGNPNVYIPISKKQKFKIQALSQNPNKMPAPINLKSTRVIQKVCQSVSPNGHQAQS